MKTNLKRVLSLVCALALCIGMLPMSALAAEPEITYSDKETAQEETGVTADKTLVGNGDGTYTITLSVQGYTNESSETVEMPADIVLVVDTSTSMREGVTNGRSTCGGTEFYWVSGLFGSGAWYCRDCGNSCGGNRYDPPKSCTNWVSTKNRLDVAKDAAKNFVTGLLDASDSVRIGMYDFSGSNRTDVSLTDNESALLGAIDGLKTPNSDGDGTNYDLGLSGAENILRDSGQDRQKFVVFLSDGEPNNGDDGEYTAWELKNSGVTIFTVGIDISETGYADRNAREALEAVSSGEGYTYYADVTGDNDALDAVLAEIRKVIEETVQAGTDAVMTDVRVRQRNWPPRGCVPAERYPHLEHRGHHQGEGNGVLHRQAEGRGDHPG